MGMTEASRTVAVEAPVLLASYVLQSFSGVEVQVMAKLVALCGEPVRGSEDRCSKGTVARRQSCVGPCRRAWPASGGDYAAGEELRKRRRRVVWKG